jgi:colanic acid/amylovoran biosynthesis glycosyltransferase
LKILYVTRELPYGMAEAHILPEIASHRAAGWDVRIAELRRSEMTHQKGPELLKITFDEALMSPRVLRGALVECLRSPLRVAHLFGVLLAGSGGRKNLLQNLASFPKALWLAQIIRDNGFDRVHVHWAGAPATFASFAAYLAGTPFSITAHRYDIAQKNLLPWKAAHAQFVRVIDEPGADEFLAALGPGGERPLVLHVGVETPAAPAPLRGGELRPLRAVAGARLVEKKGHAFLIEGVARAKTAGVEVALDLFGDGPLEEPLKALAQKLGVADNIRFCGVSSHESLLAALRAGAYDVAALPSVTGADGDKEGIPVFLMEAMAAGVPVLTTPNGGILELAGDGNGVITPERDSAAIGDALVQLARDEALRRRLSEKGRAHVQADFAVETNISRLRALIAAPV